MVGLVGLEPMSSVRNSRLAALPLATLLCSLGLRPAFIRHRRRQGSGPSTIAPVIGLRPCNEYSGVRWAPSPDKLSHHSVLD